MKCCYCDKDFFVRKYRLNTAKYCSTRCRGFGLRGTKKSKESVEKTRVGNIGNKSRTGQKYVMSEETKKKISRANSGKNYNIQLCNDRIIAEVEDFQSKGFRCFPTGGRVRPDFVAIKDGKAFAVEVEYGKPNYSKYDDESMRYFDDVVWILKKKPGRFKKSQ